MKQKVREYRGEQINVTYDIKRCMHAAECVRGLPAVFDTAKRPWVQPDAASADEIAEVVMRCPSGALQFRRHDGGSQETASDTNKVTLVADGPLYLQGNIDVFDSEGTLLLQDTRVALCRCGQSENKPFCDGAHTKAGFQDSGDLHNNGLGTGSTETEGKLVVRTTPNGPVISQGEVEIYGADGQMFAGTKCALCRCGASNNKPFCDGTHVSAGFEAA